MENEVISPNEVGSGHPRGMPASRHAALPCIDTHSSEIGSCHFPFLCPYIHSMILEEDSSKQFGVPSIFEFFMIFQKFQLPKIIKNKIC